MKQNPGIFQGPNRGLLGWAVGFTAGIALWAAIIAALISVLPRRADGQFFDPDACLMCQDSREHLAAGAAIGTASRLILKKPWQRIAFTGAVGAAFELGQWDAHRGDGKNGTRGFGFGPKDLLMDVAGAVAAEGLPELTQRVFHQSARLTGTEQWLRAGSSVLIFVDWSQTIWFRHRGIPELNPILGPNPSIGRVNTLIGAGLVTNALLVPLIPKRWARTAIWTAVGAAELRAIVRNRAKGIGLSLSF